MHHPGLHDGSLVIVSILVAVLASFAALDLAARIRTSSGRLRYAWLGAAAFAMGGGIWSMHFVAMLAFRLPGIEVGYDLGLTAISLVLPIAVTAFGFFVASIQLLGPSSLTVSGHVMGLGIAGMHYAGMAAMRMSAGLHHEPQWVVLSILIAIAASIVALRLAFTHTTLPQRLVAALVMGMAIAGMHYTAMHGAVFTHPTSMEPALDTGMGYKQLALWITGTTVLILILALVAAMFDRQLADLAERETAALRVSEKRLHRLLGSLPAAVYTTDKEGRITFCNKEAIALWGVTPELGLDKWTDTCRLYYPDGRLIPLNERPLTICLREGRPVRDVEAILERQDGERIPVLPCPAPLFDEQGAVVGVINMQVDLTARKRAEAALAERNAQLELASRAARVGSFTIDFVKDVVELSPGFATVLGLPETTLRMSREEVRMHIHPQDLALLDALRGQAVIEQRRDLLTHVRVVRADNGETRWIELRSLLSYDKNGRHLRMIGVSIDVTERKQAEDQKTLLIAELDHRVKNALTCVDAMINQTRAASKSMDEFISVLGARIQSLANTHSLLSASRWSGVGLAELVRSELAPCMHGGNTIIEGPTVNLSANAVQPVAIVLHELATNAAKYGALSNSSGQMSVRWNWRTNGSSPRGVTLEWLESGGPPVVVPFEPSYGMSVIRDLIPYELGGAVDHTLALEGARCTIEIPAEWVCTPDALVDFVSETDGANV